MTDPAPWIGRVLQDRYELLAELGSGGMAVVFRARDRKLERQVAVKIMRDDVSASLGADRFLKEIRLLTSLTHPNIVGLLDAGEDSGALYYVMPLIEGESLADRRAREGSLPLDQAVAIALDVARALSHAHALGIVHRDIKPGNIMLAGGAAMVADFGIAKAIGEAGSDKLTATGMAIGTVQYMSPEQAHGSSGVDHRTDQYALASVLYELLAGEPPFSGGNPQAVLVRKTTETARPLRTTRETVSPQLEAVILQALSRHPADRYVSAFAFAEALSAAPARATPDQIAAVSGAAMAVADVLPGGSTVATPRAPSRPHARWGWLAGAAAVAGLALAAAMGLRGRSAAVRRPGEVVRVAFLPCTADPASRPEAEGALRALIGRLQRVSGVVSITTSAAERFRAAGMGYGTIADSLGATFVARCEGFDGNLELTLYDRDGADVWRERFPSAAQDGLPIALAFLDGVHVPPDSADLVAIRSYGSASRVADSLYQLSLNYVSMANDSMTTMAMDLLNRAIGADSLFGPAWAMLSRFHFNRYRNLGDLHEQAVERRAAARAAQVALRLSPRNPDSHLSMAYVQAWLDFNFVAAHASTDTALALAPFHPLALQMEAFLAAWAGRRDSALRAVDRGLALEPSDQLAMLTHGFIYYLTGHYTEAVADYRWVNQIATDHPADGLLVWALIEDGRLDAAREVANRACTATALADQCSASTYVAAAGGDVARVNAWVRRYRREIAAGAYARLGKRSWKVNDDFRAAEYFAMAGSADSAFAYLERAYLGGCAFLTRFRIDPHFKNLRADPRFEDLALRIGLAPLGS